MDLLLRNRRTKTEIWKKDDIDKFFELTDDVTVSDDFTNKNFNDKIKKYSNFIIKIRSRFAGVKDDKLREHTDSIFFEVYGCDDVTDERFVTHVFCGYALGNPKILRILK